MSFREYGASFLRADELTRLDQQILYFCGERTIEPMKRLTEIVLARLLNCRFVTVPGANHMLPFTHTAEVVGEIEAHVAAVSAPRVLSAA